MWPALYIIAMGFTRTLLIGHISCGESFFLNLYPGYLWLLCICRKLFVVEVQNNFLLFSSWVETNLPIISGLTWLLVLVDMIQWYFTTWIVQLSSIIESFYWILIYCCITLLYCLIRTVQHQQTVHFCDHLWYQNQVFGSFTAFIHVLSFAIIASFILFL